MTGQPCYGYVLLDSNGNERWDTFVRSNPNDGQNWVRVFKTVNACVTRNCDQNLYDRSPNIVYYEENFNFVQEGDTSIHFNYGVVPTKFKVYKNDILVLETGYVGLSSYQSAVDSYNDVNGFPDETVQTSPTPSSFLVHLTPSDILTVRVYSVIPQQSDYTYSVECIGGFKNCVVSNWSNWTSWEDIGGGEERRTRERYIIQLPEGEGSPCPSLLETEIRPKISQDCVVSDWRCGAWEEEPGGLEIRTCTREILIPPIDGGTNCPPLIKTEYRPIE